MRQMVSVLVVTLSVLAFLLITVGAVSGSLDVAADEQLEAWFGPPGRDVETMSSKTLDGTTLQCTGSACDCGGMIR